MNYFVTNPDLVLLIIIFSKEIIVFKDLPSTASLSIELYERGALFDELHENDSCGVRCWLPSGGWNDRRTPDFGFGFGELAQDDEAKSEEEVEHSEEYCFSCLEWSFKWPDSSEDESLDDLVFIW